MIDIGNFFYLGGLFFAQETATAKENLFQIDISKHINTIIDLIITRGATILLTLVIILVINFLVNKFFEKAQGWLASMIFKKKELFEESKKRVHTLAYTIKQIIMILVWVTGISNILSKLGINMDPILATAGILGFAVSFGSQNLIKDIIAGIFILLEDQVRVGDWASINGQSGEVESINLRTVILRDTAGTMHIIPNGQINTLSNQSRDWSASIMNIKVDFREDPDQIAEIMKKAGKELKEDKKYQDMITDDIEIFGVDSLEGGRMVIKGRIKTRPGQQWGVGREFLKKLRAGLVQEGIQSPYPPVSISWDPSSKSEAKKERLPDNRD